MFKKIITLFKRKRELEEKERIKRCIKNNIKFILDNAE